MAEADLLYSDLTRVIIGAAMEVHSTLGPGFLENVYEEALAVEFGLRNLSFERQKNVDVFYKNVKIKNYVCDLMVDNKVLIELKALNSLTTNEHAQTLNYLKATGLKLAIIINFKNQSLEYERLVL